MIKKEPVDPPAPSLDIDSILGFPGYVKTECFSYDDSGFATDNPKDDLAAQQHQHQQQVPPQSHLQQVQQTPVTSTNIVLSSSLMDPNSVIAYQNNNNDWHMSNHNIVEQDTAESLLRSALQGTGYTKGSVPQQLQNGITIIPGKIENYSFALQHL